MENTTQQDKYTFIDKENAYFRLNKVAGITDILTDGEWVTYTGSVIDVCLYGSVIEESDIPDLKAA